jgi:Uncharacterised protein family (UPF0158)
VQQTGNTQAQEYALRLLVETITDLRSKGRPAYGATLKHELKRRTFDQFDESALGFFRFGDFLRDAEARKLITLSRSPGGDVEAQPLVNLAQERRSADTVAPERAVIRQDIWTCFIDWKDGMVRLYDKVLDQAILFPAQETPLDSPIVVEQRRAWAAEANRFVQIPNISRDEQLAWLRDFTGHVQNPVAKRLMEDALSTAHPHGDFARIVKAIPQLNSQWHHARVSQVSRVITDWMERNGLKFAILVPSVRPSTPDAIVRNLAAASGEPRLSRLRRVLHKAIDLMSEAELASLQIPVGHVLDDDIVSD